jgi:hypothetical protein
MLPWVGWKNAGGRPRFKEKYPYDALISLRKEPPLQIFQAF